MSAHKFNIFDIMARIDNKEFNYYSNLPQSDQRAIAPLVLMRWLTGCKDEQQIVLLNEFVNTMVFNIHQHPDLLWRLMCACSSGRRSRYQWTKVEKKQSNMAIEVIKSYYNYSSREAASSIKLLSAEDILQCAIELGYETTKITKLKKELK